ncbi:WXG100-like domain-containing protein [Actinomycetospora aeridis]|uniref:Outer membrane channel protein CpnT-like N-terminal domain-containing protein n=1 Tax=Actinomycetospora aeridis TaxID=3129231 RepID=A0ABU8N3K4_9PSEU
MSSPGDAAVDTVVSTVGLWWPDAEEEELRAAADAWERAAVALDRAVEGGRAGAGQALQGWEGEAAEAFRARWAAIEREGLLPSAEACRSLAGALRRYADEVETAKHEIQTLAVEIGAGIVLGAAMAWFTFGASAAAAAGVAARLVALAAQIGVRVSTSVAGIVSTSLTGAAFGAVDGVAANTVAQVYRVEALDDGGYSAPDLRSAAAWGAGGGVVGAGWGGWATRALRHPAPDGDLLRGWGDGIRAALEPTDWGRLYGAWRPGLDESANRLLAHERLTAQRLADEGAMVHSRRPREVKDYKNPDVIVRAGPQDPGTYTELKVASSSSSVSNRIRDANAQLADLGGGHIVIDGRTTGLTAEMATDGWRRALRNMTRPGETPPESVRVLLSDGEIWFP